MLYIQIRYKIVDKTDSKECFTAILDIVDGLASPSKLLLRHLMALLRLVASHSHTSRMNASTLATVFAPLLLPALETDHSQKIIKVVRVLICRYGTGGSSDKLSEPASIASATPFSSETSLEITNSTLTSEYVHVFVLL